VRVAWNVTKIRQMLRGAVFHGLVAVVLLVILFFIKSIFTEYFSADDEDKVDTLTRFSTIVSSRISPGKSSTQVPRTAAKAAPMTASKAGTTNTNTSSGTSGSSNNGANAGAASQSTSGSVRSSSTDAGSKMLITPNPYGSISPLPPHVIPSRTADKTR
jgi:hypothetical protein